MQNIPGIALEPITDKIKNPNVSGFGRNEQQGLFAEVFAQHSTAIENELAMAPVTTTDKMLESAPLPQEESKSVVTASTKVKAREERVVKEDQDAKTRNSEERMTREDMEKVKEDLEAYGMSAEEIAEIEKKVNSEKGMTWKEFASTLADKMESMRKASISDDQREKLATFFAKFGFTTEESDTLIARLENGEQDKVVSAMQTKLAELPKAQQLLLTKDEVEAFSSAMRFSTEFTAKIKEMVGTNSTAKEVKEAFTLIRQELAGMDAKDRQLVKAVGREFAQSMGETLKASSAARDIEAAVDLKPRVAEDSPRTEGKSGTQTDAKTETRGDAEARTQVREDFKGAVETRKESMPAETAKKSASPILPEKSGSDTTDGRNDNAKAEDPWGNLLAKLKDDSSRPNSTRTATDTTEQLFKTDTSDLVSKNQNRVWDKVDAPKVMRQVETAIFKNLSNGTKQLTLQLTPENLGKLNIVLQVQGKEVNAVIRADSADAARVINENIEAIRSSLESQGLKVEKLEVQTGLTGNQDSNDWAGSEQHNLARDREVMTAMRKHMRAMRGDATGLGPVSADTPPRSARTEQGIHVIA
ncbi:MAG: flagellar hook-length control protein FliK [Pseudodesulfovibrio sp.]|uniref:Flagellar hook-length control protein-like, C-terminal domain protein n=1 Tax=Pseudodesulfovibrio aespoeensis (strain ATCC 700646 / DSM 10631 / Aspo-2) TaxID=643562 RepID=E6VZV3_PSEA9|nr:MULTISPECIES: flagellar hook-length control protein FliK [Pseudodesulfovibrio]MBU4190844.1 flagellar hook-length control protein FliK [Pseudomonadota bacterium]ADU64035.1 Flagellar hook-length control protein-like, C-terminal domain protein [Pseudodesulfovibrio aespoeensis Aspo-2]MBU4244571.1 flagellar hook-length control protein FliK [Pseudomonadota bacterium]MBU4378203.1 flagellar hook-length control protein FliK [Pseudomonadota bacterium]MBU4475353.1 flagellar hook-length control protein